VRKGPLPPGRAKKLPVLSPPASRKRKASASSPRACGSPPLVASPLPPAASPPTIKRARSVLCPRAPCPRAHDKKHNKAQCYNCGGGCKCDKPGWKARKRDCKRCFSGADGIEARRRRQVANNRAKRCALHDAYLCAECMPKQRAAGRAASALWKRCDCPPPDTYSNRLWCRKCEPGLRGTQARMAKSLSSTLRDGLSGRRRPNMPADHQSMVLPFFWSCGGHDVAMLGPPSYLAHYLSINPKLTAEM